LDTSLIFSLLGVAITLGGIFIAVGVMKGKLNQTIDENIAQSKKIDECANRSELAQAIKRSDEMLELLRKREAEDREKSEGKFKEVYEMLGKHSERITALETSQQSIQRTIEDIRKDLNGGFKDIREELREMRKQG
jgi:predicted  nucleic acid-binding Zn-ribbon protein